MTDLQHITLNLPNGLAATGTSIIRSPWDQLPIAKIDLVGSEHVEAALATAYSLFQRRTQWLPLHKRVEILEKTIILMRDQIDTLTIEAAREGGKPYNDSHVEVLRAIDGIQICIDTIKNEHGGIIPMGASQASANRIAFSQKEPIGVVVAVSAFNHPLNLIVHQVGAAIATGCPTIVKPADLTPLSCIRFVNILYQAGLPEPWCQVLIPQHLEDATRLVTDPRVGFFSFIGSAKVGWMLRSKLSPGTRCALEHGGAAPVIVCEDADIDLAVQKLGKGGFYHAGQVCVSVQRVFAHQSIYSTLADGLQSYAQSQTIDDPVKSTTDVGPLITPHEVKRIDQWVTQAIKEGATCISGGEVNGETSYQCTVLGNPASSSTVSQKEIFGPVINLYEYTNVDLAISQANALPFSFQAGVFTQDIDRAMQIYKHIDASAVMLNDHSAFRIDGMPFAGLKQSGLGIGGIPHTIADMQIEKMLVMNSPYI